MTKSLNEILWNQLGAAIDSMERAINACPDKVWGNKPGFQEFWYMVYHTLFFIDFYLSDTDRGFNPPEPFTLSELEPAGVFPGKVYSKEEMLSYLEFGRNKARTKLSNASDADLLEPCNFSRKEFTVAELMIYNTRHVQHHTAQLNLLLRQQIDDAPKWVSQTKLKLP